MILSRNAGLMVILIIALLATSASLVLLIAESPAKKERDVSSSANIVSGLNKQNINEDASEIIPFDDGGRRVRSEESSSSRQRIRKPASNSSQNNTQNNSNQNSTNNTMIPSKGVFYVSSNGSDSSNGSIEFPWKTIQHALDSADSGSKILLRDEEYNGGLTIKRSNITLTSFPGESARIVSPIDDPKVDVALRIDKDAFFVSLENLDIRGGYEYAIKTETWWDQRESDRHGASYLTINNSKIHDSGRDAIKITPGSDHINIINSEIYNSGRRDASNAEGIDNVNGDYFTLENSYIHDIATNGLYVKGGAIGARITNNKVERTGYGGILVGQDTDVIYFKADTNHFFFENINGIIEGNKIYNTGSAGIGVYAALNATIKNNLIINSSQHDNQAGILITGMNHYFSGTPVYRPTKDASITGNNISMNINRPVIQIRDKDGFEGVLVMSKNSYHNFIEEAQFWDERSLFKGNFSSWQLYSGTDKDSAIF